MILRNHVLAALAAATCALAPAAFSQEPPSPSGQQDVPPTTTDEDIAPGAATDEPAPGTSAPAPGTSAGTSAEDAAAPGTSADPGMSADSGTTAGPIEDKKIEQFADAYVAVQTIQQKAAAELQSANNPEQADKVKATAESDMIAAVERTGLQVPEFNRIVERMASDTEVRTRVATKLQERSGGATKQPTGT